MPVGAPNPYQNQLNNVELNFNTNSREKIDSVRMIRVGSYIANKDSARFAKEMSVIISALPGNEYVFLKAIQYLSNKDLLNKVYPMLMRQLKAMKANISKEKMIAKTYMTLNLYDSASSYFEKALITFPKDTTILLDLGFIHLELEEYAKAANDFTRVLTILPNNKEAYHQRGVSRFELKNYNGTVEDMTAVIKLSSSPEPLPYLIRGYAQLAMKNKGGACDDWKSAAALGSSDAKSLTEKYCP